eukprot:7684053-Karenia_brevis.AAC.1
MGTGALERWNQITSSKQASLPPTWHFSLDNEFIALPPNFNTFEFSRGEQPLVASWLSFSWQCLLDEVENRF